ncbi:MAG TPA: membrane protein FxsA [Methanosarcinaceae archaeon]|nr:membrane protein FxsA [Methanosarcinaceae archaeon]
MKRNYIASYFIAEEISMFVKLLALFIVVPFVELYILLMLSSRIGTMPTLGIVIITGIAGAALAKHQGLGILRRIRTDMAYNQMPGDAMIDGVMVLVGSVLLLTPGILTDITGFLLLIPLSRALFKQYARDWVSRKIRSGEVTYQSYPGPDR